MLEVVPIGNSQCVLTCPIVFHTTTPNTQPINASTKTKPNRRPNTPTQSPSRPSTRAQTRAAPASAQLERRLDRLEFELRKTMHQMRQQPSASGHHQQQQQLEADQSQSQKQLAAHWHSLDERLELMEKFVTITTGKVSAICTRARALTTWRIIDKKVARARRKFRLKSLSLSRAVV